jgi:membrane protein YqaA with SNARE-associated domain
MAPAVLWKWLTVVALAMTPALVLGQSAAATAGLAWHLDPRILVPVIALAGFVEGMLVAWLGGGTTRIGFVRRWCERMRKPKAVRLANTWGPWGGLTLGVAVVGQEPILLALRWLGVDLRRLVLPVAVSNVLFAAIYYAVVRFGVDRVLGLKL